MAHKYYKVMPAVVAGMVPVFGSLAIAEEADRKFISPYEGLDWRQVSHHDAEYHTHPGLGGEEYDPHQTVDRYHEEGYEILTLAAHDYDVPDEYMDSIYPWTELSQIYEDIKHAENPTEGGKTYEEIHNEPWEDRDPVELGMISIEGNEISAPHHTISLFSDYTDGADTTEESFDEIGARGGMAYFAHPGRYRERWDLTAEWYVDYYERYDMLIGQSIYNRRDHHPGDRAFYDEVQHKLGGADRPIWLFGEDDMHSERDLGWNRNVMLLEDFVPGSLHEDIQDGAAPEVMKALENGYFYLWKPTEQYNRRAFNIINVEVDSDRVELSVDNEELVDDVRWRTHNPETGDTETVHHGYSIVATDVPEYAEFVRAELHGNEGRIYTQPFYLVSK